MIAPLQPAFPARSASKGNERQTLSFSEWQAEANGSMACSSSLAETVAEEVVEIWDRIDLLHGSIDVVFHPAEVNGITIEKDIAGAPVPVARLADRADVDHRLEIVE